MKKYSLCAALLCLNSLGWGAANVTSVPALDLTRYLGTWYEIAHLPMFFQRHCIADTTAHYTLRDDGRIAVLNRCRTTSRWQQAQGVAKIVNNTGNAQLKVSFFWPFWGNYWVISLDPDYRWALVGEPNHRFLWLLSRTPTLSATDLNHALNDAVTQGYDLKSLIYTPQTTLP